MGCLQACAGGLMQGAPAPKLAAVSRYKLASLLLENFWGFHPQPGHISFWRRKKYGKESRRGLRPTDTRYLIVPLNKRRQPVFGECLIITWTHVRVWPCYKEHSPAQRLVCPMVGADCPLSSPACAGHYQICGLYRLEPVNSKFALVGSPTSPWGGLGLTQGSVPYDLAL